MSNPRSSVLWTTWTSGWRRDCIVTKAGPGTIAEAATRGLPCLLSSHLPGQEAGNVKFVVEGGFGAFVKKPAKIGATIAQWFADLNLREKLSSKALEAARPSATLRHRAGHRRLAVRGEGAAASLNGGEETVSRRWRWGRVRSSIALDHQTGFPKLRRVLAGADSSRARRSRRRLSCVLIAPASVARLPRTSGGAPWPWGRCRPRRRLRKNAQLSHCAVVGRAANLSRRAPS